MRLNELRDNPGATKARKRIGRGPGSGKGKTAGRGHKGQKSRSGVAIKGFEGGQMPIHRRLAKRGFTNIFKKDLNEVNLGRIQSAVDKKSLDPKKTVTVEALLAAGIIRRARDGVRVLGKGEIKTKLSFEVTGVSTGAQKAIEKAGGSVTLVPMPKRAPKEKAAPVEAKTVTKTEAPAKAEEAKVPVKKSAKTPAKKPAAAKKAAPAKKRAPKTQKKD
jgi:large subunit ribosomal protein L15